MAKSNDIDIPQLCLALQHARLSLRFARETRLDLVREYAGENYSEESAKRKVLLNLLAMYVRIMGRSMVPQAPRVMLSTFNPQLKPVVHAMDDWVNKEIVQTHFEQQLRRIVVDAFFSVGIAKVSITTPAESAMSAWSRPAGMACMQRVDLDDFAFDPFCADFLEAGFIAHRCRAPLDIIRDDGKTYSKGRKDLQATEAKFFNQEGDERIGMIGRGYYANREEYGKFVDLWEVYLPRHRTVVTLSDDQISGPTESSGKSMALREQRWIGPETGPYHILGYGTVPGNPMPVSPLQHLWGLHRACNENLRKVERMGSRIKELLIGDKSFAEDLERLAQSNDGDILPMNRPDAAKTLTHGGTGVQIVQGIAVVFKDLFDFLGGGLALQGGLGPQSKTLGQDKMLNENSSASVADMQGQTTHFAGTILKSLLWYWHHDPYTAMRSVHSLGDVSRIVRLIKPQDRQFPFEAMDFQLDPYSMQPQTPDSRAADLSGLLQTVLIPLAAQLQSQGVVLDMNKLLQLFAQYKNMPDLQDIATVQEPPQPEGGQGGAQPPGPANTTRTYERTSGPGTTTHGADRMMATSLMGKNPGGNPQTTANGVSG